MRIAHGLIAMGIVLVAGCGTTTGVASLAPHSSIYRVQADMPTSPSLGTPNKQPLGMKGVNKAKQTQPGTAVNPTQAGQPAGGGGMGAAQQTPGGAPTTGVKPPTTGVKPPSAGVTPPGKAPSVAPGVPPAGGGGGPINFKSPDVSKAMSSLNLKIINKAEATSELTSIQSNRLELSPARGFSRGIVSGVAPQALSILRANLSQARFLSRNGLFIPYVVQGAQYGPLIVTVSGRQEMVFFTRDCVSGRYLPHSIVV